MIEDLQQALESLLPLRIDGLEYHDPVLTLGGQGWALSLVCPWRLQNGESNVTAWDEDDVGDASWDLVGHHLEAVTRRVAGNEEDPVFELSGGFRLEVFADTDLDPWVLRLPTQTIVGRSASGGQLA